MNLDLYSPLPYLAFDFECFPGGSDLYYPLQLNWPANLINQCCMPQVPVKRQSLPKINYQKKTHILKFQQRQKKCKRPMGLDPIYISGCRLVRFGTFAGIRDARTTRCPFRGLTHGIFTKSGYRCPCRTFTLCPSPLVSLLKTDSLFAVCKAN
ncbi:hypothetical protein ZYGR_0AG01620 [Zygosaccharomyces rouxii]|uniref:Uncharacterized protein n=1 Tax=Zygosaccharomyces rouxii TaxID=4956 RepID=A0A1Q3A965_ZYGRO|nr:hypothetical protein ZYGR_0AG01620 [Zygosaccharomyces rouxii]